MTTRSATFKNQIACSTERICTTVRHHECTAMYAVPKNKPLSGVAYMDATHATKTTYIYKQVQRCAHATIKMQ